MKILVLFISTLFYISTFSQTVKSIDKLIYLVDHSKFTDSITILDTSKRLTRIYHFKIKLTHAIPLPPGCGILAYGHLQKFEVLSTDFPNYNKKFVLIIAPCPESLGDNFFQSDKIYEVDAATNSGVTFEYIYFNNYERDNLPIFWSRKIINAD